MTDYQNIGNPVDTWWNHTRQTIDPCIDLLAQFPPAPNSQAAKEMISAVHRARNAVLEDAVPHQGTKIQSTLIECLNQLEVSLHEQAIHGLLAKPASHNMAYHRFLMVSYYLLQRGIYEPEPTEYVRQGVG